MIAMSLIAGRDPICMSHPRSACVRSARERLTDRLVQASSCLPVNQSVFVPDVEHVLINDHDGEVGALLSQGNGVKSKAQGGMTRRLTSPLSMRSGTTTARSDIFAKLKSAAGVHRRVS
jgi:hypothetical protein